MPTTTTKIEDVYRVGLRSTEYPNQASSYLGLARSMPDAIRAATATAIAKEGNVGWYPTGAELVGTAAFGVPDPATPAAAAADAPPAAAGGTKKRGGRGGKRQDQA